ncbi:hypothetical protein GCM10009665_06880 [Kitasatospora nipponensis]|uniref:Uncharacterized protein n=1 Tax=Kitasatospora nipponensis TaxID=258049 RepID=A0ABP4GAZ9_9ACTN
MRTDDPARSRPWTRAAAMLAVVLGLILMHGNPAAAAGGCHGTMSSPAVTAGTTMRQASEPVAAVRPRAPLLSLGSATWESSSAMDGTLCVSTSARGGPFLPPAGLLAALFVILLAAPVLRLVSAAAGVRRRGPPVGGRGVLLLVCVMRN